METDLSWKLNLSYVKQYNESELCEAITDAHLCWSLLLMKLQAFRPATSLRRDSNTGVFL